MQQDQAGFGAKREDHCQPEDQDYTLSQDRKLIGGPQANFEGLQTHIRTWTTNYKLVTVWGSTN